jgi:hypothetical protein
MIIAGFEGVGKSVYANTHPDEAIDFGHISFKYELGEDVGRSDSLAPGSEYLINSEWSIEIHNANLG